MSRAQFPRPAPRQPGLHLVPRTSRVTAALLAVALLLGATAPAAAQEGSIGVVDNATGEWYLRDPSSGATTRFFYGDPGDLPMVGDWDCDGDETPGLYRQSDGFVYLRNSNNQGVADIRFFFGNPGDIPLAGDFDGDDCDTVSIYRPAEGRVFIINALSANDGGLGAADSSYFFGNPGDKPFVGDFDDDETDEVGLHRESTGLVYFRFTHTQGVADAEFIFGDPGDKVVAAEWAARGAPGPESIGLFRPSNCTSYLRHSNTQGVADQTLTYGVPSGLPVAGDFGALSGGGSSPPGCPSPPGGSGFSFPSVDSTGPRVAYSDMEPSGTITTSHDGQVIEGMDVTGNIRVIHDNVTVRDSRISFVSSYGLNVRKKADGSCPTGTVFEFVEVDGRLAAENDIPVYSPGCEWTLDHAYVHNVGRTTRMVRDNTVSNSYIHSSRTGDSGAHRGAVGLNGGHNNKVINNVLLCEGVGCSAALAMYGDTHPIEDILVEHNLMAATAAYCAYGGSVDSKPYPEASNVRFVDNHFSTMFFPDCGRSGPITAFDRNVRGNVWEGNIWHETGQLIP